MNDISSALIGYSGFVGSTLYRQRHFDETYRSTNIADIEGRSLGVVICAGAPAQKWIANADPAADRAKIDGLIAHLRTIRAKTFVLVSTVDVFRSPIGVDEASPVEEEGLHAYGLNRRRLERFVEEHFENALIVRLPGLVGPGLRKNVIYDFLNDNNVNSVDSRGVFQFYPMVNLWFDIQTALAAGLRLVHLSAEPVSVADISGLGFGTPFENHTANTPAVYDMRTRHAALFGGAGQYQYSRRETLQAVRAYAQSEPQTKKD
ncbi:MULTISPECIES: pyridine nucleotide transhydrogenase [Caballeronia]|uniref:pyridine nucleotide transhydrogenase n=1 Tax=Caballeronia TaxID=1827195 RepID=UPI001EF5C235|nr:MULTISPECIES: pyridine nucleotide transhydrogenase [Caballeronia]MCG7402267.1 pyridine nucleotide transhydrogenase [Caballeronia zhejiangensis]MCI1047141.1 NAD(P)-dependent oxidoreductase [Caballeronia zhejiangensis]